MWGDGNGRDGDEGRSREGGRGGAHHLAPDSKGRSTKPSEHINGQIGPPELISRRVDILPIRMRPS